MKHSFFDNYISAQCLFLSYLRNKSMTMEIERKFLIDNDDYKSLACKSYHIIQAYPSTDENCTVRIRLRDDKGFITIKGKSDDKGLSRYEWEKEIREDEAKELIKLCRRVIDKTRYIVEYKDVTIEVDEFHGDNDGLVIAEVEVPAEDYELCVPEWFGKEVTGDIRYYNSQLLQNPYKNW